MAHLIDKDALVAEIEKLIDKGKYHEEYDCAYRDGNNGALYALKGKLDTLEVKEIELTWEDVREIYCITLNLREHLGASVFGEPLYQEVLKRFLKERKEK